jgi:hypothetical protein
VLQRGVFGVEPARAATRVVFGLIHTERAAAEDDVSVSIE